MKCKFTIFLILILTITLMPQHIRPVRDNIGFCWNADEFTNFMELLDSLVSEDNTESCKPFIGGISPHDDFLYAGRIYYPLYKNIEADEVVIFGVTHGTVRRSINDPKNIIILESFDQWTGPYGTVSVSPLRNAILTQLDDDMFIVSDSAHMLEHSIEALIPFLQYHNHDIRITPVMVTAMNLNRMQEISDELGDIIIDYMKTNKLRAGSDIAFLISADANHYGAAFDNTPYGTDKEAHKNAVADDKSIAENLLMGPIGPENTENFIAALSKDDSPLWCGRYSIPFGVTTINTIAEKTGQIFTGEILQYSDTWTERVLPAKQTVMGITAPFSLEHWVGFLSAGFCFK